MATENVIMAMVRAGGDHQECHEKVRVLSHEVGRAVKGGKENNLVTRLQNDPYLSPIADQLSVGAKNSLFDPPTFIGRAPQQVEEFVKEEVEPVLEKYRSDTLQQKVELRV